MAITKRIPIEVYMELYAQAVELYKSLDEPIPEMNRRSEGNIKYILKVPFQTFFGRALYKGFYRKAAVMFYLMNKDHPLDNGNKRLACMSLELFYEINGRELKMTDNELYQFSKFVAVSEARSFKQMVNKIETYLMQKA